MIQKQHTWWKKRISTHVYTHVFRYPEPTIFLWNLCRGRWIRQNVLMSERLTQRTVCRAKSLQHLGETLLSQYWGLEVCAFYDFVEMVQSISRSVFTCILFKICPQNPMHWNNETETTKFNTKFDSYWFFDILCAFSLVHKLGPLNILNQFPKNKSSNLKLTRFVSFLGCDLFSGTFPETNKANAPENRPKLPQKETNYIVFLNF